MLLGSWVVFLNVSLRGLALVGKFFLVFFLAKYLSPDVVGIYGLLAATVGYSFFILGFEFYTYSTREMLAADSKQWLVFVRDQAVFFFLAYLIFLPLLFFVFLGGVLPWKYACWFFFLLILEHAAQEINRLLVVMSEQLLASFILFVRGGVWCFVLIFLMWWMPSTRSLEWVFGVWSFGVGLACLLGFSRVIALDRCALSTPINWSWIGRGVKVAMPLLVASLAIRGLFVFDRYWVESVAGLEVLAAYILFIGIASAVISFLDAGVIVFSYPKIVAAAKANDLKLFNDGMRGLFVKVLLAIVILVVGALLVSRPVLFWIGKGTYVDNFYLLEWLLLATALYALSMVPHVGLYAWHQDKVILYSQLFGLLIFFLGVFWGAPEYGVVAIPWALCLSFFCILVWKFIAFQVLCGFKRNSFGN